MDGMIYMSNNEKIISCNSFCSLARKNIYTDADFNPVRNITNRARFKKITGKFPSLKMGRTVRWESQIERDFLYLLEFDTDVLFFIEQPEEISYVHMSKTHRYYPDFYVERRPARELIEIKPASKVNDPDNKIKFLAGEEYCRKNGYVFRVVTDKQIRYGSLLGNIKLLYRYAAVKVPNEFKLHVRGLIENRGEMNFGELLPVLKEKFGQAAIYNTYSLLYHQLLIANLNKPLSDTTAIKWTSKVGE